MITTSAATIDEPSHEASATTFSLIDALLNEQQQLTPVEKFARQAEIDHVANPDGLYHDLIPLSAPGPDQQYAFEVDLDTCSGCKACVAACHQLNDLEEHELWRNVGLLHGGTSEMPMLQHVTSACHHCLEPACLHGCPAAAYEKDEATGIVRHLEDNCIGCQYCTLKCPYDVPRFSKSQGIVRKCDMCYDRLTAGQSPACVASCPNEAIRIRVVDKHAVLEQSEANLFLPGAPEPYYTLPTTVYKTERSLPRNLLPADYYSARPQNRHLPLVVMLVLTQMSVGAFVVERALMGGLWGHLLGGLFDGEIELTAAARSLHVFAALLLGMLGLAASVLHLGRPLRAHRALIGLRTSWLSREILAFSIFAALAIAYTATALGSYLGWSVSDRSINALGEAASISGVLGVLCSVMIYVDTQRPFWNASRTGIKFLGTALVLGIPTSLVISLLAATTSADATIAAVMDEYGRTLCQCLIVVAIVKLLYEHAVLLHLRDRQNTRLKRTAMLMTGELGMITMRRLLFGVLGGVILPGMLVAESSISPTAGFHEVFVGLVATLSVVLLLAGELIERSLYFAAVVAPKMPGAPAS